jgi:vancomycin resistance protein YoaR
MSLPSNSPSGTPADTGSPARTDTPADTRPTPAGGPTGTRPRRRSRRRIFIAVGLIVAVLALATGAYALDTNAHTGTVARGVTLGGQSVAGDTQAQLAAAAAKLADSYKGAAVHISSPKGDLVATAAGVGLALDQPATVAAALAIDQNASGAAKPLHWARSLVSSRAAPLVFTVDQTQLAQGVTQLEQANHVAATEPGITATDTGMVAVPGAQGQAIDLSLLAQALKNAAETGTTPIAVEVLPGPLDPTFTDADAKALAAKANDLTKTPLALSVGGKSATIPGKTVRTWLAAAPRPTGLVLTADQAKIVADLPTVVGDLGTAPTQVGFTLAADPATKTQQVQIIDGVNGTHCCAPDSAARIAAAVTAGQTTVTLDLEPVPPDHDHAWAEKLGVVEPIGTFTTPHECCQDRVINIHRIADIVRGMYIEPGATFSVNERVGKRTAEKGFVDAPVIYNATHDHDIGGGVSQFATTLFNAAFFGGLDLVDYQSHSLIISRYPTGREATISWEKPDLKIRNNTPYGVMIWPTYTDTSLTVTLYSTKWVSGEQTGQTTEPKGPCTKYTTERTRTYVDGHTDTDKVYALYQPADGVKCP